MEKEVTIFTTPTCSACRQAKEFLARKGIPFKEHDVASDAQARKTMFQKSGRMAVPTIVIGEEIIIGFDIHEMEKILH
ncbi:glutaredoxin family protein [Candidatus Formimonas warabiya]|uniref:NrdH-redoxin n=1 Tax=Formimonas warabiya TaxID=1761012 RepID=A0A3G1L0D7_FORW1|nr:glutaredoxin family protein [Candidatus Formimonas warabiya]ATW28252.1 NrdH-redoxin [Candidatus Formimonas warabiya]